MEPSRKSGHTARRRFLKVTIGLGASALAGRGGLSVWRAVGEHSYQAALDSLHRPANLSATGLDAILEIARYATMAPNSHNTQPWQMLVDTNSLRLLPDWSRRCPVVDPDDHHLQISLGCAAENAVQAATAYGMRSDVSYDSTTKSILCRFEPRGIGASELFAAIPRRQSTRAPFDGTSLSEGELNELRVVTVHPDVDVKWFTSPDDLAAIEDVVVRGNQAQMENREFVRELKHWVRFGYGDALRTRDGLFSRSTSNSVVPAWVGDPLFDVAYTIKAETEKYKQQIRTSAGVAVFIGREESGRHWADVGRCFERFALKATSMRLVHSHINQPVEVPEVRTEFSRWLGAGRSRPDLVIRFGRGQLLPPSLRRPVETLLVSTP